MHRTELENLIRHIADMTTLVYSRERQWGLEKMQLMPPANRKAINALLKERPYALPSSYVQFLELHDGCLDFWAEFALLGTGGKPKEIVDAEIEDARGEQGDDVVDPQGNITPKSIAKFEGLKNAFGENEYFLPAHTVFGANEAGGFLFFNEKKPTRLGEYEVVDYSYDARARTRYADFPTFLLAIAGILEARIRDKGYASSSKPPISKTKGKAARPK